MRTGGKKERKGVLTCRHVMLTSAVLERQVGEGGDKQRGESDKEQWREMGG